MLPASGRRLHAVHMHAQRRRAALRVLRWQPLRGNVHAVLRWRVRRVHGRLVSRCKWQLRAAAQRLADAVTVGLAVARRVAVACAQCVRLFWRMHGMLLLQRKLDVLLCVLGSLCTAGWRVRVGGHAVTIASALARRVAFTHRYAHAVIVEVSVAHATVWLLPRGLRGLHQWLRLRPHMLLL